MKNIFIFGHSRAGKTSLAKRLKDEFQLNVVNEDNLVTAFERAFPQLNINGGEDYEQSSTNITPFMVHYLHDLAVHGRHKTGSPFVADITFFDFDIGIPLLQELGALDEFIYIFLDNTQTAAELFADVRAYDTEDDWSYTLADEALRQHCAVNIGTHDYLYEKWPQLPIMKYDVAAGRAPVFDQIVADLRLHEK